MTTFTNPETSRTIPVFVHEVFEQHGAKWAKVNKGTAKTCMTFSVIAAHIGAQIDE